MSGFPTYRISTSKTPSEFLSRLTLMGKWAYTYRILYLKPFVTPMIRLLMMVRTVRRAATFLRTPWWMWMAMTFFLGVEKLTAMWDRSLTSLPRGPSTVICRALIWTLTVCGDRTSSVLMHQPMHMLYVCLSKRQP